VVSGDREGWVAAETLRVRFRVFGGEPPRLEVEDAGDPAVRTQV
jgi:hypothetical protein